MKHIYLFALCFSSFVCNSQIISTVAGNGTSGFSGDNGPGTSAQIIINSIGLDASGNLYIGSTSRIRKVNPSGTITTFAGKGSGIFGGDGGQAILASFNAPNGRMVFDKAGNMYFGDLNNHRVRKIASTGIITTIVGDGTSGYFGDGGPAISAQISVAYDIAIDTFGNLYIADKNNHCIRKVSTSGTISTFAGNGTSGFSGDGGLATAAQLSSPEAVCVDDSGNVFIGDFNNNRIRKVATSGIITTVAGTGVAGYSGDGASAVAAKIIYPNSIAIDKLHNLYVACDTRIRKISTSGIISTIVGNDTPSYSGDGGLAINAKIVQACCLSIDDTGNIFIGDIGDFRVRKISVPSSTTIQTAKPITEFSIYPNPANTSIWISGNSIEDGNYKIVVKNSLGESLIFESAIVENGRLLKNISISELPYGIYTIELETKNTLTVHTIIKQSQ